MYRLNEICKRVTRKNKNIESTLPLTISAQYGLVDQITFFNKSVASSNLEGYYLLKNGEFAYNKSYSKDYPWGAIKRLDKYEQGCLSTLYICFDINKTCNSDYLVHYFESPKWYKQVSDIAGEGARNHGLLNISVDDFFQTKHRFPSLDEQVKVSKLLNLIETRIQTQNKIIEDYKKLKKQIIDSIFSTTDTSWAKCSFKDIFKERKELHINDGTIVHATLSKEGIYPKTDRYDRDFLVKDEDKKYKVSYLNDICYNPANLKFGVITRNDYGKCIVSPIYVTYFVNPSYNPKFIELFVTRAAFLKEIRRYEQGTVYERMAVSSDDFLTYETRLPNVEIQNDIVESIDILDKKITQEQKYLELLAKQKDYLLSNMFI